MQFFTIRVYKHNNWKVLNFFTSNISVVIVLTVCHTIFMLLGLMMLYDFYDIRILSDWINHSYPNLYLIYSHHSSSGFCIDIVRRNSFLVTHGSSRVKKLGRNEEVNFHQLKCFSKWFSIILIFILETWSRRRTTEERWSYERKQTTKNYCYSSKDSVIKLTLF